MEKICIFGQGFVGLPLALSFALNGCSVIGVDTDKKLVDELNCGRTRILEEYNGFSMEEILKKELENKRYKATLDGGESIKSSDDIIVTVGVPRENETLNMEHLKKVSKIVGMNIKKGQLILVRSTVVPGTTENIIAPILEKESGMTAGKDFYLAYSSERIAEGAAFKEFVEMPSLVGGINETSLTKAVNLLRIISKTDIIPCSGIKVVETAKLFENIQRDVNIAMSQEFARFAEAMDMDIFEIIRVANTHSRVNILTPGAGVGGHCIPNAFWYLENKASKIGLNFQLLSLARKNNKEMPEFFVNKLEEILINNGKDLEDAKISVIGLAMKDYSNDYRFSPPVEICRILMEKGAKVKAFDPLIKGQFNYCCNNLDEVLEDSDGILILAIQKEIDFNKINNFLNCSNAVCIDVKGVLNRRNTGSTIKYWRI